MIIEYLRMQNFLSIGTEPVEINFIQYGNIVLIKGINKDIQEQTDGEKDEDHSNGAGKSTISEGLSYGLFGEFIRDKANHTNAINNITKKKLEVEVIFRMNDSIYRIVRSRKPDDLRFWKSNDYNWGKEGAEITEGGIPAVQKSILDVLKLNHKAFCNIVFFGQHNSQTFLSCDAQDKREIAESLLSLDVFKKAAKDTKEKVKDLKRDVKEHFNDYEKLKNDETICTNRLNQVQKQQISWHQQKINEIKNYEQNIQNLQKELESSAVEDPEKIQEEIERINKTLNALSTQRPELNIQLQQFNEKIDLLRTRKHEYAVRLSEVKQDDKACNNEIEKLNHEISDIKSLKPGVKCDLCFGIVSHENSEPVVAFKLERIKTLEQQITQNKPKIEHLSSNISKFEEIHVHLKTLVSKVDLKINTLNELFTVSERRLTELRKISNQSDTKRVLIKEKIDQALKIIEAKELEIHEGGPYQKILHNAEVELKDKIQECQQSKLKISTIENSIPYYEFWVWAFTDGIRSFVIERILPALNSRIAYWMHFLANNRLNLTFDNQLEPNIERIPFDGNPFVYHTMSGGLKNRLDLSIIQSFAYVMMTSSGTTPSLMFLDEIGTDFDRRGKQQIYKMICELSSERQVFVITHDSILLDMFQGVDVITMKLENGATKMV